MRMPQSIIKKAKVPINTALNTQKSKGQASKAIRNRTNPQKQPKLCVSSPKKLKNKQCLPL